MVLFLVSAQEDERKDTRGSPPPDVVELCRETFQKTSEYLKGELDGSYILTHIGRMDSPTIINWMSPLSFFGVLGVIFFLNFYLIFR